MMDSLRAVAERWLTDDPDASSRAELRALIDALPGSADELADRFAGPLTFGTAGLRGPMRAGPQGMNLAVVRGAAAGLVGWLADRQATGPIVVGYDGRHGSRQFADQTARVATGAGRRALLLPRPLPTPVLAHAVRALPACAGVMVTASHNPAVDNGYKVYLGMGARVDADGDGAQIVPPTDSEIEVAIRATGPLSAVPLGVAGEVLGEDTVESYLDGAVAVVSPELVGVRHRSDLHIAYTAMHGVGAEMFTAAFARAGFRAVTSVAEQSTPDPDFPTVAFPNPEEPGAMDLLLRLAGTIDADVAIATDPDADRCAVAIPTEGSWRALRGDEVGVLLADHLMRRGVRGTYATTVVSSRLLGAMCAARGMPYAETLTGFKWIVRAADSDPAAPLVYGYEEALGYCVAPQHVRDKDGITAALLFAELAAELKAGGRTVSDRIDEIAGELGVHATDQVSVRVARLAAIDETLAKLRARPPDALVAEAVTAVEDLSPRADVLIMRTTTYRVVIRPSGTEPKLKAYLEVVQPVPGGMTDPRHRSADVAAARNRATQLLAMLRTEVAAILTGPGPVA